MQSILLLFWKYPKISQETDILSILKKYYFTAKITYSKERDNVQKHNLAGIFWFKEIFLISIKREKLSLQKSNLQIWLKFKILIEAVLNLRTSVSFNAPELLNKNW